MIMADRCRSLPMNDQADYYSDSDDDSSADEFDEPGPSTLSNRGNKLHRKHGVRWFRRGKLGSWTEARNERELARRSDQKVDAYQHVSVEGLLDTEASMPGGMGGPWRTAMPPKRRLGRTSRRLSKYPLDKHGNFVPTIEFMSEEEKMALNAATLAPSLLRPVMSARGLLESKTLKQNFRNPHVTALSRTALDLCESESLLNQALGRCFGVMERIHGLRAQDLTASKMQAQAQEESMDVVSGPTEHSEAAHATTESADNRVENSLEPKPDEQAHTSEPTAQEGPSASQAMQNEYANHYTAPTDQTEGFAAPDVTPPLALLDSLFITPEGLTLPASPQQRDGHAPEQGGDAKTTTFSAAEQREIVYASLECLNDLYSDSTEYMERLHEVREMLADVRRNRSAIWNVLRRWALQRDEEDKRAASDFYMRQHGIRADHPAQYDPSEADQETAETGDASKARKHKRSEPSRSKNKKRHHVRN